MRYLFALFMLTSIPLQADFNLRSLKDVSIQNFDLNAKPSIYMIFQEECSACYKQVRQFSCMNAPVFLLGAFSTEKALRHEYRKMKTSYPAYMSDRKVLKKLGVTLKITPQTIIVTKTRNYHFVGLTSCQKLKSKLKKET